MGPNMMVEFNDELSFVSTIGLKAQQIQITEQLHGGWYNAYKPLIVQGKIRIPSDQGILYIGFSEKPFDYDPSGFFDAS